MTRKGWLVWLIGSTGGAAIVAAPDAGRRLFSISRTHGPSLVDTIGFTIVVLAWSILWASVWSRRSLLPTGRGVRWAAGAVAVAGTGLLTWSILGDHGRWWMLGAGALAVVQIAAAASVTGAPRPDGASHGTSKPQRGMSGESGGDPRLQR